MLDSQVRDSSEATFETLTEKEFAERRQAEGVRVIHHGGHYWEQIGAPGFFQPVHLLARLKPEEATRPTPLSWGYRAALTPEAAGAANGTVPVVKLSNLESYDLNSLSSNRRNKLRKCQRLVRIVQLTGPALLLEQGYELVVDALSRTQHKKIPTRERYHSDAKRYFRGKHWCVLAGLIDGKLGGYLDGHVVDGIAYGLNAYYASWALPTNISTGLIFEFAQICRRLAKVHTLVGGLDSREAPKLNQFKDDLGYVVEHVPIKWDMNPLAQAFIRWQRPHAYYRLTGSAADPN
ncbi:hypothetical protein [Hyalangium rubrum]|uniref:BioF2-like acetyltransferase domain-containing protein n=1 Tax=Hyalangium rubrum TaxID=3103134 RepID=A0ABU5H4D6_9BACT|nr:hypothetical protein [Hyalangium sp. s54d21]MDY7228106.1 hypothetical protein [Hyalangium sp. s54d21]